MNFNSEASYKRWLAYGHMSGVFEKTPGNTLVRINGKSHEVNHAEKWADDQYKRGNKR